MIENKRIILTISLLIGVLIFLVLLLTMPSNIDYSILNNGNLGLSRFYAEYKPLVMLDYNELAKINSNNTILLVNGINQSKTVDLEKLKIFIENGGEVAITGNGQFINSILNGLGIKDYVSDYHVYDPVLNKGTPKLVVALSSIYNSNVSIYEPFLFNVKQGEPIIATSNYSYVDLNGNGYWDLNEPIGSFIIGARYSIGKGELYVIAANGLIVNSIINYNNNFLDNLLKGKKVFIDQSFLSGNLLEYLKVLELTGRITPYVALMMTFLSTIGALVLGKSVREKSENRKLLAAVELVFALLILYSIFTIGNYYFALFLVFLPLYFLARNFYRFILGLSFNILYLYLNSNLNFLIGVIIFFLAILIFLEYLSNISNIENPFVDIMGAVLIYFPIYILEPVTVIPGIAIIFMLIVSVFIEYVELSIFNVELVNAPFSIYLGDTGKIEMNIRGRGEAKAYLYLNNKLVRSLDILDSAKVDLAFRPEHAGLQRYVVGIKLRGKRGLATLVFRPVNATIRIIPKRSLIGKKARAILEKYINEIGAPYILFTSFRELNISRKGGSWTFNWSFPHSVFDVYEKLVGKSFRGDYAGVREYIPGDSPRNIHWKKSASMGELIIKEYASTPISELNHATVVIADWTAPNQVELDMIIEATYSAILSDKSSKVLFLKVPRTGFYLVKGRSIEVLAALESIIKAEKVEALFDYESWPKKSISISSEVNTKVFKDLIEYYRMQADALVKELENQGVSRGSQFFIINSNSLSLKYNIIAQSLVEHGYRPAYIEKTYLEGRLYEA
ncbi:MAG: DUF58 domain-containing protein [Fervidicoccaceae archaeon]